MYREPVALDATELPELPPGWVLASMDAITLRITSGSRDWQQYYGNGTGTFVMAQNVRPGRFDPSHHQPVSPPPEDPSCERSRAEHNDLLVTIVGANTGDVCRVPKPLSEHYVCQSVALMRPIEKRTAQYLEFYYNSQNGGQKYYRRYIYGAGRPHLSFDQLKMTPVAIPPLAEQEAIVDAIEDQLSIVEHLAADLEAKLKNAQALRQSVLRNAFSGRLVRQNPKDEPASELLKRIAAEREQRARDAAAAKKLNGHMPRRAAEPRNAARAETTKEETEDGRITDR
jgi:type I restriction enzyme, S subunit